MAATLGLLLSLRGPSLPYFFVLSVFVLFCLFHRRLFRERLLIVTFTFLLYYLVGFFAGDQLRTVYQSGDQTIYGTIKTIPIVDGDSLSFRLTSVSKETLQVHGYIYTEMDQHFVKTLSPGDLCKISGTLTAPLPPTNFEQFNYKRYLQEQGIFWILRPSRDEIQCIEPQTQNFYTQIQRWRHKQLQRIEREVSPEFNGIMSALLFGERALVDGDLLEAYQRLGVIHLLAVSGLHVGMIVGAVFYLFIRIGITRERAMEVLLLCLPIYIIVAGAAPSVVRASLMAMVVLICLRIRTRIPPLLGIVAVYLTYLLIQPYAIFQLGFQLSFLVSFGLIVSAATLQTRYTHVTAQLIAVTVISQVLSTPILLRQMYEFSWLSIPLNIIYIPFITLIVLPLTFVSFFLFLFMPVMYNYPLLLLEYLVPSVHTLLFHYAQMNQTSFVVGKPSLVLVYGFYGGIMYGLSKWEEGMKNWWIRPVVILAFLLVIQLLTPYFDSRAKVTMIDVGQGDSFLIELPYRRAVYLIDTGGTISFFNEEWRERRRVFDVGADIVVPALKSRGIRQVDRLILTHGHLDHIGGAQELGQSLRIQEVIYSKGPVEGENERQLLRVLSKRGAGIHFLQEGMRWKEGASEFTVLSPVGTEADLNARSIVLYVILEKVSFLFTGDLEEEGERRIVSTYPNIEVDVLKAGHHGSRTSTTEPFLTQLKPKIVLISAGRNNRFGHPHEEVTKRLEEQNIPVWRSDLDGAVQIIIKEGKVDIRKAMDTIE
ncbi:DNA internalization-related competence protein ComEC/Rec2 [Halalkalibacter kiskunsagensis]|uniref:DNA internalization-related competence protein ComEC/Rec2 n=1 Tax=Halalkalibacter kiskunsagensis TaxID=1548599 RepID=A0ABV6KK52_9BACI